jgi:hypothetical protein
VGAGGGGGGGAPPPHPVLPNIVSLGKWWRKKKETVKEAIFLAFLRKSKIENIVIFKKSIYILVQKVLNFESFYQFYPMYDDRNVVK